MSDVLKSPTLSPTTGLSGRKSKIPLLIASPDKDRELRGRESRSPGEKYDDSRSVVSPVSMGRYTGSEMLKKSKLPVPKLLAKIKFQKIKDYAKSSKIPRALKRSSGKIRSKTNDQNNTTDSATYRETATDDLRSADSPVSQGRASASDTLKKSKLPVPRLSPKTNTQTILKDIAKGRAIANVESRSVSPARETGADSSRSVDSYVSQTRENGADRTRSVDTSVSQASETGADSSRSVESPVSQASETGADSSRSVDSPVSQARDIGADNSRSVDSPVSQASETGADSSRPVESPVSQSSETGADSSRLVKSPVSQANETGADSSRSVDSPVSQASETGADRLRSVESPVSQASETGADSSRSVESPVSQANETGADSSRSVDSPVSLASETSADSSRSVDSPDSSRSAESPVSQVSETGADSSRSVESPVSQASETGADSSRSVDSPVSLASETGADSSRSVDSPVSQTRENGADRSRSLDTSVSQASKIGADSSRSVESPLSQASETGADSLRSVESPVSQASETSAESSRSFDSPVSLASETGADSSRSVDSPVSQTRENGADRSRSLDTSVSQASKIGADSSRSVESHVSQASETGAERSRSVESPVSQANETGADSSRSVESPVSQANETGADNSRSVDSPVSQSRETGADSSQSVDSSVSKASETGADSSRAIDSPVSQGRATNSDALKKSKLPVPRLSPKTNDQTITTDDVMGPRMPRTMKRSPAKLRSNSKRGKLQGPSSAYDLRAIRSIYGKPLPKITKSTNGSVGNRAIGGDQLPVTDTKSRIPTPVAKTKAVKKKKVDDKKSHRAHNELDVGKPSKRTVKTKRKRKQPKDISSRQAWDDQTNTYNGRTSRLPKLISRKQCPTWHGDMAQPVPNNMTRPVLPAIGTQDGGNTATELARTREIRGKGEVNEARCAGQHAAQKKGRPTRTVQDNFTRMRADMAVWKEIAVKKMADNLRPMAEAKPRGNMSIYRHGPIPRGNPYMSSSTTNISTRQPLKAIHNGGGDRVVPYRPTQEGRKCGDVSGVMISVENVAAFVQSSIVYLKGIGDAMDKKWRTANEIVGTFEQNYKHMCIVMGTSFTSSLSSVSSHEAASVYTPRSDVSSHEAASVYTPRSDVSSHEAASVYTPRSDVSSHEAPKVFTPRSDVSSHDTDTDANYEQFAIGSKRSSGSDTYPQKTTDANLNAISGDCSGSNDRDRANSMVGDANETANVEIGTQGGEDQPPKKTKRRRLLVKQTKKSSQMIQFNKQPKLTPITPYSPGDENYRHSNTCLDVPGCDTPSSLFSSRPLSRVSSIDMDVGSSGADDSDGDEIHSSCCGRATHSAPGQLQRGKQQKRRIKFRSKNETRKVNIKRGTDTLAIANISVDHRKEGKDLAQPGARSDKLLPDIPKSGTRSQHSESANAGDEIDDGVTRKKAGTRKSRSSSTPTLRNRSASLRALDIEEEKSYAALTASRAAHRPLSSQSKCSGSCTLPDLK